MDLVGHTVNDDVPETVTVLNKAALITRLTNLSIRHLLEDRLLTAEEIETAADNFISKHD